MTLDFWDEEDVNDYDVVIVGAGLTGLSTAYNILRRKPSLNILIIEGTDKAGGRILSQNYSESFYASLLQERVTQLIHRLNIDTCSTQNTDGKRVFFTKDGPVENFPSLFAAEIRYFIQVIQKNCLKPCFKNYVKNKITRKLAITSVDQLLKELVFFSYARSICSSLIYSTCGMRDLRKLSALWMLIMLNGAGGLLDRLKVTMGDENRYFVQGGMAQLTKKLLKYIHAEHCDIIYGEIVTNIQFNDDRAYCYTKENCFKCDIIVIAVPPPENSQIHIEPSLPAYVSQSQTLFLHSNNIFFNAFYKKPFWKDKYNGNVLATLESNTILNIAYDATCNNEKRGIIAGFLNDTNFVSTSKLRLFETLSQCFQNNETKRYINYKEFQQPTNEDTEIKLESGWPMSVMQPSHVFNNVDQINASNDRILFAASEYATKWPGMIDGAIEIGEVTACLILLKLRPQALETADMIHVNILFKHILDQISMFYFWYRSKSLSIQRSFQTEVAMMYYFCLAINVAIFFSFLNMAYNKY
ncbi:amine oxidase flavin-containing B-like isoform X1 [Vespula squamosa]|uniref:Amine oxidase n=1 Tax=Vespula squamosa TaxID=30214 RepID=A0ABD2C5X3_VESSQ